MKFIVDAQLPKQLSAFLTKRGCDSIHTLDLPLQNSTPDHFITKVCETEKRALVTKDREFVDSHLISGKPAKLLFVSTGNISNPALLKIVDRNIDRICELFQTVSFIEVSSDEITAHE